MLSKIFFLYGVLSAKGLFAGGFLIGVFLVQFFCFLPWVNLFLNFLTVLEWNPSIFYWPSKCVSPKFIDYFLGNLPTKNCISYILFWRERFWLVENDLVSFVSFKNNNKWNIMQCFWIIYWLWFCVYLRFTELFKINSLLFSMQLLSDCFAPV